MKTTPAKAVASVGASSPGAAPTSSAGYVMLALILVPCDRCTILAFAAHSPSPPLHADTLTLDSTTHRDASDVKIASTFIKYVDYVTLFASCRVQHLPLGHAHALSAHHRRVQRVLPERAASHNDDDTSDQRELMRQDASRYS
ncbi:hypothetical protein B0H14DRAFT_3505829 [Mycena olivaceomarginata]|nr:hypothetical protein B0H14DRAFT_3505829 [Mycena olivaceomarginata]